MRASSSRKDEAFLFSPRLILVTGGARSGKSRFAMTLARKGYFRRRLYVATAVASDDEMRSKIACHRRARNGHWTTLEEPVHLPDRLPRRMPPGTLIVLECLPTFLTNLLLSGLSHAAIVRKVESLVLTVSRPGLSAIFVTNEVGLGIVPDHPMGREFRDLLGDVNQHLAGVCHEVYLLVAGLPMRLK